MTRWPGSSRAPAATTTNTPRHWLTNLVSYGAGNIVIRLGIEANGTWEADYVGTTNAEMSDWAKCYANEVTAMRAVPGTHFLFVWNPNICTADIPLSRWYPGNSYVDIIGADAYDGDCGTLKTVAQEGGRPTRRTAQTSARVIRISRAWPI